MYQFKFADIGEGLHEGKVVQIFVKVGDAIKEGDVLFEVETDKVTSEITSPVHGKIHEIKIAVDATVHVGDVTFVIDDGSSTPTISTTTTPSKPTESESGGGGASVVGEVKVSDEILDFGFTKKLTNQPKTTAVATSEAVKVAAAPKNLKISPFLRRYAALNQIDLSLVKPTGAKGVVLQSDLGAVKNQPTQISQPAAPSLTGPVVQKPTGFVACREKTSSMRQAIAKNLKGSWDHVAYSNLVVQVDVTELWNLRNKIKDQLFKATGTKITFLPFVAKATTIALRDFPIFTAQYDEKTQELIYANTVNLGIAVDTEHGLMVPNVKDAQTKSVLHLAEEINSLAIKARDRKLGGADMANGTFTITNYGSAGSLFGVPVIKYPEMGILGVGTIIEQVQQLSVGSTSGSRKIMYLTIAADHRWVDGMAMGRFATKIRQLLENPALLSVY